MKPLRLRQKGKCARREEARGYNIDGEVFVQRSPVGHALRLALDEPGHACYYNVGQAALFQKAEQFVAEEARIGTEMADCLALGP